MIKSSETTCKLCDFSAEPVVTLYVRKASGIVSICEGCLGAVSELNEALQVLQKDDQAFAFLASDE